MSILQESILGQLHANETPAHSLRREAVPVQAVPAEVQPERQSQQAYESARRLFDVTQLDIDHRQQSRAAALLSHTCDSTRLELTGENVK